MPQRMEAVDRHLSIPAGDCHRWFQPDPADHPEHVDVHEVVADVLAASVGFVVTSCDVRADVICFIGFPSQLRGLKRSRGWRSRRWMPNTVRFVMGSGRG